MKLSKYAKLGISIVLSFAAGGLGTLATTPNIPTWYAALDKPFFNPPNWLFGPVWSILYLLMAIALYLVWTNEKAKPEQKRLFYIWFGVQLGLNALWSFVFFGAHHLTLGIIVIVALLVAIVGSIVSARKIRRASAWLFVPYIVWVSFATALNIGIAFLN